jgi:two-component system CheB/CheR fusion protein
MKKKSAELDPDTFGDSPDNTKAIPVVGIGASAGGLKPIRDLVKNLPPETGMAFIVLQHITSERSEADSLKAHHPIDHLFQSLAENSQSNSIGIVLSGLGSDGSLGIRDINSHGGVTFAQSIETAAYSNMPENAIASGCIDFVLSPEDIAIELIKLSKQFPVNTPASDGIVTASKAETDQILALVRKAHNHDFTNYKLSTIHRRISRRIRLCKRSDYKDYLDLLNESPHELSLLFNDLLINVTQFFRDPESFEALEEFAFPKIVSSLKNNESIRIWVPACSTGEEAYSLAIALTDYLNQTGAMAKIEIFATDVSESAIDRARKGLFSGDIKNCISAERLKKYFSETGDGYQIIPAIRDLCVFAKQNVISDPPFSRLHLISCRNLLIYFNQKLQDKVIHIYHYALKSTGFLFLGGSESISSYEKLFSPLDKAHRIYAKNIAHFDYFFEVNAHPVKFTLSKDQQKPSAWNQKAEAEQDLLRIADNLIVERLSPTGFVVNRDLDILQIRGDTSPYLGPNPGHPAFNVNSFLHSSLRAPIRSLVFRAIKNKSEQSLRNYIFQRDNSADSISILVIPLPHEKSVQPYFVVLLKKENTIPIAKLKNTKKNSNQQDVQSSETANIEDVERLEDELKDVSEHLQIIIEEYESANEQLKSSNEEIQSSNEELQSTNEELQTTKEEIQAANEELRTTNDELKQRNSDLIKANDDLDNLLISTRIPIVMLGRDLKISRFSPSIIKLFNLISSDIGRSIFDISASFDTTNLQQLAQTVLETGKSEHKDIQSRVGTWYSMDLQPYITKKNKINGIVISFIDVHAMKTLVSEEIILYAEDIVQTTIEPMLVLNSAHRVQMANESFFNLFQTNAEQTIGRDFNQLADREWNIPELTALLDDVLSKGRIFRDYEISKPFKDLGNKTFYVSAKEIYRKEFGTKLVLITIQDMTRKKEEERFHLELKTNAEAASRAKTDFLANMSHEIRTPLASIIGFADILSKKHHTEKDQIDFISGIKRNSKHLLELLNDILDLSKIEAGQAQINNTVFPLREEIEAAVAMFTEVASSRNIKLKFQIEDSLPTHVSTDLTKVRQILCNVIGNAIKFTDEGSIFIDTKGRHLVQDGSSDSESKKIRLIITVTDTGCGIHQNKIDRLFQPFSQADDSTTRRYGGTGLGLSLSKKLSHLLGGDVTLKESTPNSGSTFEISLICSISSEQKQDSQGNDTFTPVDKELLKDISVLVVEDNVDIRNLYQHILRQAGAKVTVAIDGLEAVKKVLEDKPDVILMDIQLPKMDGREAAQIILETIKDKPIIALTAHALKSEKDKCLLQGFADYYSKPIPSEKLVKVVKEWADRSRK